MGGWPRISLIIRLSQPQAGEWAWLAWAELGNIMSYIFHTNFRNKHTLPWKSFIVIHDDSITKEVSEAVHRVLAIDAAVAMFDLGTGSTG